MLNELMIKNAKIQEKPYKLADGNGLHLLVKPKGKYWLLRYRFGGKEKMLGLGVYPATSLKDARIKRDAIRVQLNNGIDPSHAKKISKLKKPESPTFKSVALEWHEKQKARWVDSHAQAILNRLSKNAFPIFGNRPIKEITPQDVLAALRQIEARNALHIAKRTMQTCGQIFRYAVAIGEAERDVTADLRGALKTYKPTNYTRIEQADLPQFIQKLELYEGSEFTKLAIKMILHTFVRTKELRGARWEEIDFDKKEWLIPASRMKMKEEHIVPLSKQSIEILKTLKSYKLSDFIFPGNNNPLKCMSENTMIFAMYRMGYHSKATVHGFRATASTILNGSQKFSPDVIEKQLSHSERNKIRGAYNHAQYMPERIEMMQWWSDYLIGCVERCDG